MRFTIALATGLLLLVTAVQTAKAGPTGPQHTVVKGDTLSEIARKHHVSVDDLRRYNGIEGDVIRLGQTLRLGPTGQKYTIRNGDTLSQIAAHRGVPVSAIVALNPGLRPDRIRRGQTIMVPKPKVAPPPPKEPLACPGRIVQISGHRAYRVRNRNLAWATAFSADAIRRAFSMVRGRHGSAIRARVLDASTRGGGPLKGHRSHRTGRDVDITYFQHRCGPSGCPIVAVSPKTLDVARQWTLFRYWLDKDDVEYLFVDYSLQKPLYEHAKKLGATAQQLEEWFQYPRPAWEPQGIIRHWDGHLNHVHVRFHDTACKNGCCSEPDGPTESTRRKARGIPAQERTPRKLASKRRPKTRR